MEFRHLETWSETFVYLLQRVVSSSRARASPLDTSGPTIPDFAEFLSINARSLRILPPSLLLAPATQSYPPGVFAHCRDVFAMQETVLAELCHR